MPFQIFRVGVVAVLLAPLACLAQSWPAKPVRIISTFAAGSAADTAIRATSQKVGEATGQSVVVDVQPGAGGMVGAQAVARSAPDGSTLLFSELVANSIVAWIHKSPPYDPVRDFTPISQLFEGVLSLVAALNTPFNSMKEVIAYARANPGKLAYGSNGVGAQNHLQMELIKQTLNLDVTHVPYKGGTGAVPDVIAGQLPLLFVAYGTALQNQRAGKLKIIGLVEAKRRPDLPDVPAIGEDIPGFEKIPAAIVLMGPAKLPAPMATRIRDEMAKAIAQPDIQARLKQINFVSPVSTPEQLTELRNRVMVVVPKAIKAAGIVPE
jgi:tripartite-type tricarboxylate transporter receptor subunit TctC